MVKIAIRDPNKPDKIVEKWSWEYIWRTKSKYLMVIIGGGIIVLGILAYYGKGPFA